MRITIEIETSDGVKLPILTAAQTLDVFFASGRTAGAKFFDTVVV